MLSSYQVTIQCVVNAGPGLVDFKPWPAQLFTVEAHDKISAEEMALDLFRSTTPCICLGDFAFQPQASKMAEAER